MTCPDWRKMHQVVWANRKPRAVTKDLVFSDSNKYMPEMCTELRQNSMMNSIDAQVLP